MNNTCPKCGSELSKNSGTLITVMQCGSWRVGSDPELPFSHTEACWIIAELKAENATLVEQMKSMLRLNPPKPMRKFGPEELLEWKGDEDGLERDKG